MISLIPSVAKFIREDLHPEFGGCGTGDDSLLGCGLGECLFKDAAFVTPAYRCGTLWDDTGYLQKHIHNLYTKFHCIGLSVRMMLRCFRSCLYQRVP